MYCELYVLDSGILCCEVGRAFALCRLLPRADPVRSVHGRTLAAGTHPRTDLFVHMNTYVLAEFNAVEMDLM